MEDIIKHDIGSLIVRWKNDGRKDAYSRPITTWEGFYGRFALDDGSVIDRLEQMSAEVSKTINYDNPIREVKKVGNMGIVYTKS